MKKLMKRIGAVLLAVAMMAALGVTGAFAVDKTATAKMSVTDVGEGATVKFYKIMNAKYDSNNVFLGYEAVSGVDGDKFGPNSTPTDGDVTEAANAVKTGSAAYTVSPVGADKTAEVDAVAGVYVAIITAGEGDDTIYNPILLVVGYDANNNLGGGSVSTKHTYAGNTAVAKSSTPSTPKTASTGNTDSTIETDTDKQTGSVGDVVTYTVRPTMPVYPANASNKTVFMTDTMSNGLTFDYSSLTITLGSDTYKVNNGKVQKFAEDDFVADAIIGTAAETTNGFNVNFDYDKLGGVAPVLTYKAVINSNAVVGSAGNKNTVKLIYTNNPTNGNTYNPNTPDTPPTGDNYKEKKDEEIVYTYELAIKKVIANTQTPLAGATFGIYTDQACKNLVDVVETNESGLAISNQVGAGTYYVKELAAPTGYSVNDNVYSVEVKWTTATKTVTSESTSTTYTTDKTQAKDQTQVGWLVGTGENAVFYAMDEFTAEDTANGVYKAYIKTVETTTSTATSTETQNGGGIAELSDSIPNTKTSQLPSTGGIGTYIFTVAGVAIMAVAAGLLIVRHKKKAE